MDANRGGAALVVPTYNERENLPALVEAITALPVSVRMIVVDDHSPDGTGAVADIAASAGRRTPRGTQALRSSGRACSGDTSSAVAALRTLSSKPLNSRC